MKTKKMLSLLLAMVLSTSTLTGCSNVNTLTKLPLNNNIQIVDKELENKEDITLEETKKETKPQVTFNAVDQTVYA